MRYGYYIKIDKSFDLTDALVLFSSQKYKDDCHDFTGVYSRWGRGLGRDYLVVHDGIFKPEYFEADALESLIELHNNWKWTELKLNYKDLGEL